MTEFENKRLAANCRRMKFEFLKSIGVFWMIDKIPLLKIKEPYLKLYKRQRK